MRRGRVRGLGAGDAAGTGAAGTVYGYVYGDGTENHTHARYTDRTRTMYRTRTRTRRTRTRNRAQTHTIAHVEPASSEDGGVCGPVLDAGGLGRCELSSPDAVSSDVVQTITPVLLVQWLKIMATVWP